MYKTVQNCEHCGANLSLDDMRRTDCPYCNTVYPHHSQAAQHAQVAGQMMGQMMAQQAQIQGQWRGAFGVGPGQAPSGSPYEQQQQLMDAHMRQAQGLSRTIITLVIVAIFSVLFVVGVIVALVLFA